MTRKLPWSAAGVSDSLKTAARSTSPAAPTRQSKHVASRPVTPEPTPKRTRTIGSFRSPSTSPIRPPEPPVPQVEPMHEGLHADDRYIMVEDEFESMARQFTAHLHAAEYARLKRKAREAPPKTLPSSTSDMSRTTKQNLERKQLLSRQNTALSEFGRRVRGARPPSDDEAEAVEEAKVDDPWLGTSLAGLMGEGSQAKTSLMGLDRINQATRAAKGYGRGDTEATPRKNKPTAHGIVDDTGKDDNGNDIARVGKRPNTTRPREHPSEHDADNDRSVPRGTPTKPSLPPATVTNSPRDNTTTITSSTVKPRPNATSSRLASKPAPRRSRIDDLDDFEDSQLRAITHPASTTATPPDTTTALTSPRRPEVKKDVKKDRRSRLDEVPVFLA